MYKTDQELKEVLFEKERQFETIKILSSNNVHSKTIQKKYKKASNEFYAAKNALKIRSPEYQLKNLVKTIGEEVYEELLSGQAVLKRNPNVIPANTWVEDLNGQMLWHSDGIEGVSPILFTPIISSKKLTEKYYNSRRPTLVENIFVLTAAI